MRSRYKQHDKMLSEGRHHSIKLQTDYDKFGEDAFIFSVINECDVAIARRQEVELIKSLNTESNGYNCTGKQLAKTVKAIDQKNIDSITQYIKDSYKPDGNVYCYDLWRFVRGTVGTFKSLVNFLQIDSYKTLWNYKLLEGSNCIGMNYDSDGVFITVCNRQLFNSDSNFIYVK